MKNDKKNYSLIISIAVLVLVLVFSIYVFIYKRDVTNFKLLVLDIGLLLVVSIVNLANSLIKKGKNADFNLASSIIVLVFAIFTLFIIRTPGTSATSNKEKVPNFVNHNVSEAIDWANKNNIELIQNY